VYYICMRTTLNLQDDLIKKAMKMADNNEKTAVIHLALEALIQKIAQQNLITLGGKAQGFKKINRNR
jgi:Arc/MetJ family transcription regulator